MNPDAGEKDILDAIDRLDPPKDHGQDDQAAAQNPEDQQNSQDNTQQKQADGAETQTEDRTEDIKALTDRIEALEQRAQTAENSLAEYRAAMSRGGGAPARSDFKKQTVKDEWGYLDGDKLFD